MSSPAAASTAFEQERLADRRRALRSLLLRPLLSARSDPAGLASVRRHAEWLREFLARNTGWTLQVDAELARLRKTPADCADETRGARDSRSGLPFTRSRYILFCLALAALERADRQTTLGNLARDLLAAAAGDPAFTAAGMTVDLESRDVRRDVVHGIRLLLELDVLVRIHGNENLFVDDRSQDVLYGVNRAALAALLTVRRGPSTIDAADFDARLAALGEEPVADTDDARNRRLRFLLVRRLLDDPIVYYEDLAPEEVEYLTRQRANLLRQIHEATGLLAEVRAEGLALVDLDAELSDARMPEEGTEGHLTLLLAEILSEEARRAPGAPVSCALIAKHVARLREEHGEHWRQDARVAGAERALAEGALGMLEALRLVRRAADGVVPLPAIARYRLLPPTSARGSKREPDLFG